MLTQPIAIEDVERWNDTFAREHDIDDYYERSGFLIRFVEARRLATIRRMVEARPTDRILEVGCGGGHVLRLFPECDLTGLDVSGAMLNKAERNLRGLRVRLVKGELDDLDERDGSFDKIICSEVLEHVLRPDAMLKGIRRLLKPTGRAVITLPNDHLVHRLKGLIRRSGLSHLPPFRRISWGGDHYHLHIWMPAEMHELLNRDFRIDRCVRVPTSLLPIRYCFLCLPN